MPVKYLFAVSIKAARDMRSFGTRGTGVAVFVRLIGVLFLRTVDRAERIYYAMLSRGFQGDMPSLRKSRIAAADAAFMATMIASLAVFRLFPVTEEIGRFAQELLR